MRHDVPPHSEQAETGVLGSILIDPECVVEALETLEPIDFYDPGRAIVFDSMKALFLDGIPIDSLTVREKLVQRWELEKIGGNAILADMMTAVYTSANVKHYARIIKEHSVHRKMIHAWHAIGELAHGVEQPLEALIEEAHNKLYEATHGAEKTKMASLHSILNERYENIVLMKEDPNHVDKKRMATGYEQFDKKVGWLTRGNFIVIAARPSMGKTALALNLSQNIAKDGKKIIIFSLEMSKEELTDRLISSHTGIDQKTFQSGKINDYDMDRITNAMEELSKAHIYIDDSPAGMTLSEIKSKAKRMQMQTGLDLVVIDYLQLIRGDNHGNRVQEVTDISVGLKAMARELDIPVIALAQLSRALENRPDKRPVMSDLRDSGSIEQDADVVAMIYRDDYYNEFSETPGITNIFIRKNRSGTTWTLSMKFDKDTQKFYEII